MIRKNGLRQTNDLEAAKANTYVPLQSFVEKDIPFVIGTDNMPYNPLHSLGAAVTRMDASTGEVISPKQRVTRESALKALTINAAYLSYEENKKGSIEVGKLADIAVLSEDFMGVPAKEIRDIKVLMTLLGGQVVYKSGSFKVRYLKK
jgi:predicted amidohydrolase YtcJ